jgi:hypothetical protein
MQGKKNQIIFLCKKNCIIVKNFTTSQRMSKPIIYGLKVILGLQAKK